MKVFMIVLGLLVIGIVGLFILATPQAIRLSLCLEEANKGLENNIKTATAERWNKEKVCMNGKLTLDNMQECYKKAESQTLIPISLVEGLSKMFKPNVLTPSKVLEIHNNACVSYSKYQIKPN